MATTPILGITQVTASQNSKEVTINDAIIALEAATNAKLDVSYAAATTILLSNSQATRNFMFVAKAGTANSILRFPNTVNGNALNRVFAVRNESGYQLTVKFNTGVGSTVIIPNGATRLIDGMDGTNMIVAAEPATVVTFLDLTDVPASYSGQAGRFLTANLAENALEFTDAAVFPDFTGNEGKYLVVNATEDGVEWTDLDIVASFLELTDTPNNYIGQGGKLVAVNSGATALEFIDMPDIEAVEYVTAQRWRIRIEAPNIEDQVGFGEVEFLDVDGINLCVGGTPSASSEDVGKEALYAFDGDTSPANGWISELPFVSEEWLEYEFTAPEQPRNVRIYPIDTFPDYTPLQFVFERYDGSDWIEHGTRIPATWISGEPQTFKINGAPFSSVVEAPIDGTPYVRQDGDWEPLPEADAFPDLTGNEGKLLAVAPGETDVEWIDAPQSLPPGGTSGQALIKQSGTDGDADWQDLLAFTPVTATGTGASQNITLPVSGLTDGQVLVFVNGIRYETDEYSIVGTTLNITTNASGDSIEIVPVSGGIAGGTAFNTLSEVKTEAGSSANLLAADAGKYLRFTNASAKTLTVQDNTDEAQPAHGEWHIRNAGTADLTIVEDTAVTINPPYGGTLVLSQGMSATLKRVATDEYDLLGQTVPA